LASKQLSREDVNAAGSREEKSGINPDDPIFHLKPIIFRDKKGRIDKRASVDVDKIVYGETTR
jgi:hypothetical protein